MRSTAETRALDGNAESRAIAPLVGVLLLVGVTVALATVVAVGASSLSVGPTPSTAAFDLAVDGETGTVTLEHVAGDPVDVEELSVTVTVNDEPLSEQPPVPFVGASGFSGSPSGPFNAASEQRWAAGEHASFTVASTNDPQPDAGETVAVTLAVDGQRLATLETEAT